MPETIIWSQPITFTETAQGAPGPAGAPGPQYGLRCDTSSIVRELVSNNTEIVGVSPQNINFTALKNTGDTDNPTQEIIACGEDYLINLYQIPIASIGYSSLIENGETLKPISYFKTDGQGNETQSTVADYDKIRLNTSSYAFNGDENNKNASAIKAQLSYKGTVLVELSIPFVLSNNLLEIAQIDGDKVKIAGGKVYADSIVSEAVTAAAIKAGSIQTSHFAGQVIDSATTVTFPLKEGSETKFDKRHYTLTGSRINLGPDPETTDNSGGGSIHFRNFYVDPQGNAGLRGRIEAQEGAITGFLGIGTGDGKGNYSIYIDGSDNTKLDALNINNYFRVSKDGTTSITKGSIAGWIITQDQLSADNESVGMYSGGSLKQNENPIRFFAGTEKDSEGKVINYKFVVDNNGNLYAQQANLTSGNIYGNFYVGQNGQTQGITIDGVNGDISTSQFASGAYGWRIDQNGNAEFNNATIRGKLTSVIFEKQTVSAVNGDLYIAPSYTLKKEFKTGATDGATMELTFSNPGDFPADWGNNQVLLSFSWGKKTYNSISGEIKVSKDTESNISKITLLFPRSGISIEESLNSDIQIISIGTITTENNKSSTNYKYIYLTANANDSPFIDVQDYKSGVTNPLPKVRMGRLDGITDTMNGFGQLSGYGFYCSNAYLTGELNLPQAGITNQNTIGFDGTSYIDNPAEGQTIRFWAGGNGKPHKPAENEEVEIAPFIVTQDGSLYASQGVFKGQIIATNSTFSGTISAAGIVVEKGGEGYDPTINKNHFFVGYSEDPKTFDDYVLDMSSAGLSIWEGGFRIYSDALSGWGNEGKKESDAKLPYGYTLDNKQPFPYIAAIDAGRFSTREWHNIGISVDGDNYKTTSILAREGKLFFSSNNISKNDNPDYISVEKNVYNNIAENIYFGLQDNKLQIYSNTGTTIDGGRVQVETDLYIKEIANIGGVSIRKVTNGTSVNTIGLNFIFE